jgi:aconitate hydratase 2/2-methylisocitrate dehydratase
LVSAEDTARLIELLSHRVPPGVDEAAYVKANFLSAIASLKDSVKTPLLDQKRAIELLGTMQGGYNVHTLVTLLSDPDESVSALAADQLKGTLLVFDAFHDVAELYTKQGNKAAKDVLESWANAEWFLNKPPVPEKSRVVVFKVSGETNTDDLSPAQDAWRRPDIPLHALAMLKNEREGIVPNKPGEIGPLDQLQALKDKNPGIPPMCRTSKPEVLALEVKSRQFSIVSSCFVT